MIVFSSCTEKIDIKLDNSYTRLVVEGNFSTDYKYQTVMLSKTSSYFANEKQPVLSGATVRIDDGETTFVLTEIPQGSGIYQTTTKTKAIVGKTYKLHISNVNINDIANNYEASSTVRPSFNLDSVTYRLFKPDWVEASFYNLDTLKPCYKIDIYGQEPSTQGDCYEFNCYVNGVLKTDTIYKSLFFEDRLINGNNFHLETIYSINAELDDTITIATQSITKDYLDFVSAFITEQSGRFSPLAGPPINVPSNVNNGALGYFKATSVTYTSVIIK